MKIRPIKSRALLSAILIIFAIMLTFAEPGCDRNKPNAPDDGDSLIILPLVPYDPQPADGAINIGDDYTFSWQCYNPDSLSLEFQVYMGIDSLMPIVGCDGFADFTIPWARQIRAKEILFQVYQMQTAYHAQYRSYCLSNVSASRTRPDAYSLIGITIDSADIYTYCMWAESNAFVCWAAANLDNDATLDTWQINQSGVLNVITSDFPDGLYPFGFHLATTYIWRVLVLFNADQDSVWGPIWRFTTVD